MVRLGTSDTPWGGMIGDIIAADYDGKVVASGRMCAMSVSTFHADYYLCGSPIGGGKMSFPKPFYRWRPHPWHGLDVGSNPPQIVNVYIEITPFDLVKYEIDKTNADWGDGNCACRFRCASPAHFHSSEKAISRSLIS